MGTSMKAGMPARCLDDVFKVMRSCWSLGNGGGWKQDVDRQRTASGVPRAQEVSAPNRRNNKLRKRHG